jgi:hypothetical protein
MEISGAIAAHLQKRKLNILIQINEKFNLGVGFFRFRTLSKCLSLFKIYHHATYYR